MFISTAVLVVGTLHLLVFIPVILALWIRSTAVYVSLLYFVAIAAVVAYQGSAGGSYVPPAEAKVGTMVTPPVTDDTCERMISLSEQGGILVDRSNPNRIVVNRTVWRQLPVQLQTAIVTCLQSSSASGEVEVVEQ